MIDKSIKPTGYMGKILCIDLTTQETSELSTYDYVPEYIGGKGVGLKIFNDMVTEPGMKAFDPENPLIYMTGPGCGTGLPSSGRGTFVSMSPKTDPEMVTWAGLGGFFGPALKCAGYDGIVITGKAAGHSYVLIDDGEVSFHDADADGVWGLYTIESQEPSSRSSATASTIPSCAAPPAKPSCAIPPSRRTPTTPPPRPGSAPSWDRRTSRPSSCTARATSR